MSNQKIAYVVTSGNYSDYSIDAVFSTRFLAEKYVGSSTHHEIEEWPIDFETDINDRQAYCVEMSRDGDVVSVEHGIRLLEKGWSWEYRSFKDRLLYISVADSEKTAVKAANELRVQLIALNRWGVSSWDMEKLGEENPYPRPWKTPSEIQKSILSENHQK